MCAQIIIAMVLLWWVVSYAMLAGLAMIIVVLLINNIIAKKMKAATDRWATITKIYSITLASIYYLCTPPIIYVHHVNRSM